MSSRHRPALALLILCLAGFRTTAAPAPEDLLPDDTLAFVTAPDTAAIRNLLTNAPQSAYWRDPSMQAFREHFVSSVQTDFLHPLGSALGFDLGDFAALGQGQTTLALLRDGWTGGSNSRPALVFLADVGTATNKLAKKLKFLVKAWTDQARPFQTNEVRGLPFLSWNADALAIGRVLGIDDTNGTPLSLSLGQSGPLVLLSTSPTALEHILRSQTGSAPRPVSAHPGFQSARTNLFAGAAIYAWADPVRILPPLLQMAAGHETAFLPETLARFFGLGSLKSAALAIHCDPHGTRIDVAVASPVAERSGLLKFSGITRQESGPPAFVPRSVLGFSRVRIDLKALLTGIEQFVVAAEPPASGAIQLVVGTAGKDEDPDYDLRHGLLDNLGDDVVVYQPVPATNTVDALLFPTKVVLIASPAPGRLANAVRVLANTLSPEPGSVTHRMSGETRIYHLKSIGGDEAGGGLSFAAVPGYLAFSSDETLLEALLKPAQTHSPALADLPGLGDAAAQVGGLNTGWFSYQNQREELRLQLAGVQRLADGPIDLTLLGRLWLLLDAGNPDRTPLFDYKLHPPFDAVAKYLGFSVAAGEMTDAGYRFRIFTPAPALATPLPASPASTQTAPVAKPAQP